MSDNEKELSLNIEIFDAWERVEQIDKGRIMPATREILMEYIEEPLRDAAGILYDKNILTLGSSCNFMDWTSGDNAWITLDEASLSPSNMQVVDAYKYHEHTTIQTLEVPIIALYVPIEDDDYPADVGRRASELACLFQKQPFSWAPKWNLDEARRSLKPAGEDLSTKSDQELIGRLTAERYYFDESTGLFYMSEEHFQKALERSSS